MRRDKRIEQRYILNCPTLNHFGTSYLLCRFCNFVPKDSNSSTVNRRKFKSSHLQPQPLVTPIPSIRVPPRTSKYEADTTVVTFTNAALLLLYQVPCRLLLLVIIRLYVCLQIYVADIQRAAYLDVGSALFST